MTAFAVWLHLLVSRAQAQIFNGPGLEGGVVVTEGIEGPYKGTLRQVILDFLYKALGFLAIVCVVMIVIAGFTFVLSSGEDTMKDRAKKMIYYTIIGMIVIMLARSLVGFFMKGLP